METTDTSRAKTESGSDGDTARAQANGAASTRRKLSDQQEREVTRLYAETETPVSEISKRFGIGESSVYRVAQRHGAALRGRSTTAAPKTAAAKPSTPRAAAAKAKPAAAATTGRGRGRVGRPPAAATATARAAGTSTAGRAAGASTGPGRRRAAAASTGRAASTTGRAAAAPSGNGRRTRGTRGRPAGSTTGRRGRAAGGALATTRSAGRPATRATGTNRVTAVAVTRRSFRVSYVAVRVFVANSMSEAIRQAEAAGATDITGIERA
jgi:transposase-like protein